MIVLLVDDEAQIRDILSDTLETAGFGVHTCESGEAAQVFLASHDPEIMVTDLRMPGIDGLDLLRQVRADHPDMQVVILTGFGDMKSAIEAMRLGAYDYLNKPIDADRLIQTLKNGLERRRLIRENRTLIEHLTEANRLKTEFLNRMSHEVRTPLGHITGFAEILASTLEGLTEKQTRYFGNIQKAARNLLGMFDDMLQYIRLSNNKSTLSPAPFTVSTMISQACAAFTDAVKARNLAIDVHLPAPEPTVVADEAICEKILTIFLENAVLFAPDNSPIVIDAALKSDPDVSEARRKDLSAVASDAWLHLSVIDKGPGIAPEDHERIFDLFEQIDGSLARAHNGTGLGLALGKSLARLHNGVIDLKSAPGKGSAFTLVIPVSQTKNA